MTTINPEDLGTTERVTMEILALANETANRIHPCVTMLRQYKRGYPTGGDTSGDGTSRTEALGTSPPDIIDREQRELTRCLDQALRAMRVAYNITARYAYPCRPLHPGDDPADDIWCRNCLRYNVTNVRYRGDACRDCYDFKLVEKVVRPKMLIDAKSRGERITQTLVARALGKRAS